MILGCTIAYACREIASSDAWIGRAEQAGPMAQAFGVPVFRHYATGLALYGLLLGAAGVAATRTLGYVTANAFGLPWSLTVVMIVLASRRNPLFVGATLPILRGDPRIASILGLRFGRLEQCV